MAHPHIQAVIVGAGFIGSVHAAAVRGVGATVRGVVGSTPSRSAALAEEWNVPARYPDLAAVLADDAVDVVHICTPNALHADQAVAAMRAGKHVICEKPIATSIADAERLAAVSAETGRTLAVPYVYRYHPLVREIRARRMSGDFGAWQLLHGSYLQDWMLDTGTTNWRVDAARGGPSRAFADIGSHWCDLVEWVAGVRFHEVTARLGVTIPARPAGSGDTFSPNSGTSSEPNGPNGPESGTNGAAPDGLRPVSTEDVAAVLLRTADGVLGSLTVSQVSAGRKNRLWFELDGADGSAVFDQENPESVWLGDAEGARLLVRDPGRGSAEQRRLATLPPGHTQGYGDCFRAFVDDAYSAMAGHQVEGLPTAADGVRSAHLVDAVLRADDSLAWTVVERAPARM